MDTERARRNDNSTKAQYAFVSASIVTGIIALVWITTVPAQFQSVVSKDVSDEEVQVKAGGDLDSFIDEAKNQLGNVVNSVKDEGEKLDDTSALGSLGNESVVVETESAASDVLTEEFSEPDVPKTKMILIGTTTEKMAE